jgi:hypothetical protein
VRPNAFHELQTDDELRMQPALWLVEWTPELLALLDRLPDHYVIVALTPDVQRMIDCVEPKGEQEPLPRRARIGDDITVFLDEAATRGEIKWR